jgi:hypothetical protein
MGYMSTSQVPPEIVFHRCIQKLSEPRYRGKEDLDRLAEPKLTELFKNIQDALTRNLNEEPNVPEHLDCRPFHLDYVQTDMVNALAFRCDGYSFIGITMPLVYHYLRTMFEVGTNGNDQNGVGGPCEYPFGRG